MGAHGATKKEQEQFKACTCGHNHARALFRPRHSRGGPTAATTAATRPRRGGREAAAAGTTAEEATEAGPAGAHRQGLREAVRPRVGGRPPTAAQERQVGNHPHPRQEVCPFSHPFHNSSSSSPPSHLTPSFPFPEHAILLQNVHVTQRPSVSPHSGHTLMRCRRPCPRPPPLRTSPTRGTLPPPCRAPVSPLLPHQPPQHSV